MNDFETVRKYPRRRSQAAMGLYEGQFTKLQEMDAEFDAALDRIEAEVERLRAEKNAVERNWLQQETELQELRGIAEDLRVALDHCLEKATKHGDSDIEDIARAALAKEDA